MLGCCTAQRAVQWSLLTQSTTTEWQSKQPAQLLPSSRRLLFDACPEGLAVEAMYNAGSLDVLLRSAGHNSWVCNKNGESGHGKPAGDLYVSSWVGGVLAGYIHA